MKKEPLPPQTVYIDPRVEEEERAPKFTREEAIEIVTGINTEIVDEVDEVARMTTLYQRLHAAEWIFRARAIEEQFSADKEVEETVHQVARRLTGICKVFWPGSVKGLQAFMTPAQSLEGLVRTKDLVLKWDEAAQTVTQHLEDLSETGIDEHGWADWRQCLPEPPDPDVVLEEAVAKIEDVLGALHELPDNKKSSCTRSHIVENMEELVLAAHLLRWSRRRTSRPQRWGRAMGLLRWAARGAREDAEALRITLADEFQPTMSWAALLGRDPEIKRKIRVQREVLSRLPAAEMLEEDVMDWLVKAFTVLTNPQIVKITHPVHDQILQFTDMDFADTDRSARSRLRKLQKILKKGIDTSRVELPSGDDLKEGATEEETPPRKKFIDPAELLLECVQERTAGKRVLFVGNRDDTRLQKELESALRCEVTIKNANSTREKVLIDATTASKFDLVLVATNFVGHTTVNNVCRKAKSEEIPFIRVSKGRVAATVRAVARAFNLSPQRKEADELTTAQAD